MPTYGSFETVSELHRSPLASVWSARRGGGGDVVFAVKLVEPNTLISGREGAARAVSAFLEQAEVQRRAAMAGGAGSAWAPVHESGVHEDGAYLVTDLYSRSSVERLISGRFRVDGPALHRVASAVVQGLVELDRACQRPHGNLKPTNVLVAGDQTAAISRVSLTDPAGEAKAKAGGTTGDLRALGAIIHQFVTHQQVQGGGGPVAEGRAWTALGASGRRWLALTNRLLDPTGTPATLEEVAAAVAEAGAAKSGGRHRVLIAGAGAAVLLAAVIGGYSLMGGGGGGGDAGGSGGGERTPLTEADVENWKRYCNAYVGWGSDFIRALDQSVRPELGGVVRRDAYASDADLGALVRDLLAANKENGLHPARLLGKERGDPASMASSIPEELTEAGRHAQFEAALGLLDRIESLMTEGCATAKSLGAAADDWEKLGWTSAATGLRRLSTGQAPSREVRPETVFDDVLVAGRIAKEATDRQAALTQISSVLSASGDRVLLRFSEYVREAGAGGASEGIRAVQDLGQRLDEAVTLGKSLSGYLEGPKWQTVDAAYFSDASPVYHDVDATAASRNLFDKWLEEASNPAYSRPDPNGDPIRTWRGEELLEKVKAQITELQQLKKPASAETERELAELETRVNALKTLPWTRANVAEKAKGVPETEQRLARLWGELSKTVGEVRATTVANAEAARKQLTGQKEIVANSMAINTTWAGWRDALAAKVTDMDYEAPVTRGHRLAEVLGKFNEKLPAGLGGLDASRSWSGGLTQLAATERERIITEALRGTGTDVPADPDQLAASLDPAAEQYRAWLGGAEAAAAEAKALEDLLDAGLGLSEAGADGTTVEGVQTALLKRDPKVVAVLTPVTQRVEELRRIDGVTDTSALRAVLAPNSGARPEAVIAAWRRLGRTPAWPGTPEELRQEAEFRRRALVVAGLIRVEARKAALTTELERGGVERWTRAFGAARTAAEVEAVAADMGAHGVNRDAVTDPSLKYNLLAADLKRAAKPQGAPAPTDAQIRELAGKYLADMSTLGPELESDAKVMPVRNELTRIAKNEKPAAPPFEPNKFGPGTQKWRGEKVGDSTTLLRYTLDGPKPLTLEFRRLDKGEGLTEPVYLCTTELSVGVMLEVLQATDSGAAFAGLTKTKKDGVTGWTLRGNQPAVAGVWLENHRTSEARYTGTKPIAAGIDQGHPDVDTPVQQVSPAAALFLCRQLGCRLPTPAEWHAAAAMTPPGDLGQWNLRDATWKTQYDYIVSVRDGALAAASNKTIWEQNSPAWGAIRLGVAVTGEARTGNDSDLWFRGVTESPGSPVFLNMYGNVMELLHADAAEQNATATSPEAAEAAAAAPKMSVIGGSALSPISVSLDQPQPIEDANFDPRAGYADVGLRLAFSAQGGEDREAEATLLAKALTEDPYLYRRP